MVLHVVENLDDYYKQIMNQKWTDKLIICYFTASWCGPCKMISPDITTLGEKADNLLVLKIDVDDCDSQIHKHNWHGVNHETIENKDE